MVSNHVYGDLKILNLDAGRVPCAVHVAEQDASNQLLLILGSKEQAKKAETRIQGLRHVSDMHMFANLEIGDVVPVCHLAEMEFPLRHFSSDSTGGLVKKIAKMKEVLGI